MIRVTTMLSALALLLCFGSDQVHAQHSINVPDGGRFSYKRGPLGGERVRYSRFGASQTNGGSKESTAWDFGLGNSTRSSGASVRTSLASLPTSGWNSSSFSTQPVGRPVLAGVPTSFSSNPTSFSSNPIISSTSSIATFQQPIEWTPGTPWTPAPPIGDTTTPPIQPPPTPPIQPPPTDLNDFNRHCCIICCCDKSRKAGSVADDSKNPATEWNPGTEWSPAAPAPIQPDNAIEWPGPTTTSSVQVSNLVIPPQVMHSTSVSGIPFGISHSSPAETQGTSTTEQRLSNLEFQMQKLNESMNVLLSRPAAEVNK